MPIGVNNHEEIIEQESINPSLLHSAEVTELISTRPTFLVRWGVTILFAIAVILITTTWFIKYPDLIHAKGTLTSVNAPKLVSANTDGRLLRLFVKEGEYVNVNAVLGFMESTANHQSVIELSQTLDSIGKDLQEDKPERLGKYFVSDNINIGELQPHYQVFRQAFLTFSNYLSNGFYPRKKAILYQDMANLRQLHSNLLIQKKIQEQDVSLAQQTFDANDTLRKENIISAFDYRNEKSKLLNKSLSIPQLNASLIGNESQQNDKQKEIMELENNIAQQKLVFEQALNTFKSQTNDWMKKYLLIAPIKGKISFASLVQENQQIKINQPFCFIIPQSSSYYAEVHIPQTNFGKIKLGQKVLLKLPAYPNSEFGSIEGRVEFVSNVPSDSGFTAKIMLPNGLTTNYTKQLYFRDGLQVNAEIITKNLRLIQRFYYSLKKQTNFTRQ